MALGGSLLHIRIGIDTGFVRSGTGLEGGKPNTGRTRCGRSDSSKKVVQHSSAPTTFDSLVSPMSNRRQEKHCILLIQPSQDSHSRTYTDHASVGDALASLVETYENGLRGKNQAGGAPVTYSSAQLLGFLDSLHDLSMLAFTSSVNAYVPYDRTWIKTRVYGSLQRQQ